MTQKSSGTGSGETERSLEDTAVGEMDQFPSFLPLVNSPPLVYCDYCCQPLLVVVFLVL